MPLVGPERDGERADVAVKRIGLLQNEAEMPRTPGFDLFPFLAGRPQWDVELFTERTFGGIGSPSRIDALVVGYNSLHLSKAAREAFEADPPTSHPVVLHQLGPDCLAFLRGDLSISLRSVPGDLVTGAWLPKERSREREVALSWPAKVAPHPAAERREATAEAPPAGASGADDPAEPDV